MEKAPLSLMALTWLDRELDRDLNLFGKDRTFIPKSWTVGGGGVSLSDVRQDVLPLGVCFLTWLGRLCFSQQCDVL
jgi:hypothetical protein